MVSLVAVPLGFVLLEYFALGVVADDFDVDEAAEIELFRAKHGHLCCLCGCWNRID